MPQDPPKRENEEGSAGRTPSRARRQKTSKPPSGNLPLIMRILFALALVAGLGSCQVIPSDFLSLEARAIVVDDAEGSLSDITEEDADLSGYGLHAAIMTGLVDVVGGIERRDFEDSDATELVVGLRKRLFGLWRLDTYIEANLRYGFELDTGDVSEDYFGWNAGFGALVDLTDTIFLNFRVMYDTTDLDVSSGSVDVDGLIGTIGIGVKL